MSITRTPLDISSPEANRASILQYLRTNAQDYFKSITISNDGNYIVCKANEGDEASLTISPGNLRTSYITIKDGEDTDSRIALVTSNISAVIIPFNAVYQTSKGLYFVGHINKGLSSPVGDLFISRSNEHTTGIVYLNLLATNGELYAVDMQKNTTIFNLPSWKPSASLVRSAYLTTLTPMPLGNGQTYADGVYITNFTQYKGQADSILDLNGKKYAYDGYIALEE